MAVKRNKHGHVMKGSVLNPRGRPKRENSLAMRIRDLINVDDIINEVRHLSLNSPSENIRMQAYDFLMNWGHVKPAQRQEHVVLNGAEAYDYDELQARIQASEARLAELQRLQLGDGSVIEAEWQECAEKGVQKHGDSSE